LHNFIAHDAALCEVAFSRHDSNLLASVGDDRALNLWDVRAPLGKQQKKNSVAEASSDEILTVDWNYQSAHLLATAGKYHHVRVWDLRSLREPVKDLLGHAGDCVAVRWAPADANRLASCSSDASVIVWDLEPQIDVVSDVSDEDDSNVAAPPAPELLFRHTGHGTNGVADLSWSPEDES
jgi:WD40 repeat protein